MKLRNHSSSVYSLLKKGVSALKFNSSRVGGVVRPMWPGFDSALDAIFELILLVLYSTLRSFSGYSSFPLSPKTKVSFFYDLRRFQSIRSNVN